MTSASTPDSRNAVTAPLDRSEDDRDASVPESRVPRGVQIGPYLVLSELGRGGMSVVYRAYDPRLHREVALKLLRGESNAAASSSGRARLLREAQSMARLTHPNVVPVFDVGTVDGEPYVAMELVDGQDLHQWLSSATRDWRSVLRVFTAAGRGLAAAHSAGIVHRDFKPGNVLIGDDGRVCVGDFGLARGATDTESASTPTGPSTTSSASLAALASPLTEAGSVMGTPAYMAPEQHAGAQVDARGDQYAFCVALWQALYGARPFDGDRKALAHQKREGKLPPVPGDSTVPPWVHRVLVRGLAPQPEARWPSMAELVAALDRDPSARRRSVLLGLGVIGALVGTAWVARQGRADADPTDECATSSRRATAAFGPAEVDAIERGFAATELSSAPTVSARVVPALQTWSEQWGQRVADNCRQARAPGPARSAAYLRLSCLERGLVHFEALVDVLAQPDATTVRQAVSAVQGLPSVHRCDDADTRMARLQAPTDPVTAARVEQGRDQLATAEAMQAAGRYAQGQDAADAAYAIASELDYRPLQAEALHRLGLLAMQDGEFDTARRRQREAFFTAVAARHDEVAARAATDLVFSTAMLARLDEAEDWSRHAETIADAADLGPEVLAWLYDRRGVLRSYQGRHGESLADHEQALAILEPERAPGDLLLAKFVMHTGLALEKLGRLDEARVAYERALAAHVAALGPSHPDVATMRINLGDVLREQGELDRAIEELTAAEEILRTTFGDDHPHRAVALGNLGICYADQGRFDDALDAMGQGLDVTRRRLGDDHPRVADAVYNIGVTQQHAGRTEDAYASFEDALRRQQTAHGPDSVELVSPLRGLAELDRAAGREPEARARLDRALAILRAQTEPDAVEIAEVQAERERRPAG